MNLRRNQTELTFLGSMVGSALGDAIGELAFKLPLKEKLYSEVDRLPVLEYTDDTAMAIGIAESISELGKLETHHLGETFRRNYERQPWRGYAAGPPMIFSLVRKGLDYETAAKRMFGGTGSFGNGAAMRAAPVGLFFHDSKDIYPAARSSAIVTHTHPLGIDGAVIIAKAVAMALNLEHKSRFPRRAFCMELRKIARTPDFREQFDLVTELVMNDAPPMEAADMLGRSVAAQGSVPFAVYSFLKNPDSFEECLENAVLSGGDRDTLGAMACAISGAYLGIDAIPSDWRTRLENRDYIESLALRLFAVKQAQTP